MQFKRFYSLNQIVVAWFAHLHLVGFQPTSTNLRKLLDYLIILFEERGSTHKLFAQRTCTWDQDQIYLAIEYCLTPFPPKHNPLYYESLDKIMTFNDTEARKEGSLPLSLFISDPRIKPWDIYPLDKLTVS
jgi:hypothetical protein